MSAELSEIEKQRLINIQRNKDLLRSMQIGRQTMEQSMKEFRSGRNTASPSVSTQNTSGEINVSSDNGNSNANGPGAGSKRSSPVPAETGELRRSKRARAAVYNELVLARKVYSDAVEENDSVTKADTSLPAGASKDDSDSNEEIDTPSQRRRRLSSKRASTPLSLLMMEMKQMLVMGRSLSL